MAEDRTRFDSEVRKLVMKKNGGEVTPELFWSITVALGEDVASLIDAVEASNEAGESRHADTLHKLAIHVDEDAGHRRAQAKLCAETHAKLLHRKPRRWDDPPEVNFAGRFGRDMDDPPDSAFTERRESAFPATLTADQRNFYQVIAAMSVLKKALAIALTALIIGLVGIGVTYVGSYYAADRVEKVEIEQHGTPTPTVTVTVSPEATP